MYSVQNVHTAKIYTSLKADCCYTNVLYVCMYMCIYHENILSPSPSIIANSSSARTKTLTTYHNSIAVRNYPAIIRSIRAQTRNDDDIFPRRLLLEPFRGLCATNLLHLSLCRYLLLDLVEKLVLSFYPGRSAVSNVIKTIVKTISCNFYFNYFRRFYFPYNLLCYLSTNAHTILFFFLRWSQIKSIVFK